MLFMNHNWDSFPIVHYRNVAFLWINLDSKLIHFFVSLVIVRSVYQHLIENLVESWCVSYLFVAKSNLIFRENPFCLLCSLYCPNVSVWSQKDMFQWGFLLINLFHRLVLQHFPVKFNFIFPIQYFIIWLTLVILCRIVLVKAIYCKKIFWLIQIKRQF